ncbi:MAG: S-layer homology domain-containing protein [Oscillospiraceae bacterium]|nr:S-layer homology domain-containing protein [Oscillospiraceae bacterium]
MKKKLLSLALAAVMVVMMGTPALATSKDFPFSDVPSDHWARQAVHACWYNGVVNGISDTEFYPSGTLTRAQFITMIGRAAYEDEIQSQITSSDSWYSGYVRYLSNNGYLAGISTDETSLSQGIPRQEMALLIYNIYKGYNSDLTIDTDNALNSITDVSDIGSNYLNAVSYCYATGLLSGYDDGSFGPNDTLTRAEACTVIYRATYYWVKFDVQSIKDIINAGISTGLVYQELSNLIIENINDWREENGLNRLQTRWFMNAAAAVRAEECSIVFSHTRPNGIAASSVYEDLYGTNMGMGEIIVSNQNLLTVTLTEAADTFVEQWKNSVLHNAVMLSDRVYIGCGVYISSNNVYSAAHFAAINQLESAGYGSWVS